jgi:hypothetical protein
MLKTGTSCTTGNGYLNGIEIPEHGSGSELHFRTKIKQAKNQCEMKTTNNRTVNKINERVITNKEHK